MKPPANTDERRSVFISVYLCSSVVSFIVWVATGFLRCEPASRPPGRARTFLVVSSRVASWQEKRMTMRVLSKFLLAFIASGVLYLRQPERVLDAPIGTEKFGQLIAGLSEPEGYFDSDNFVSNEAAYLRVLPAMNRLAIRGGAYLGVGPDQNYTYIAEMRPRLAVILDIRRQNALQHLYFKALFQLSRDRDEYLERLFGRLLAPHAKNEKISELLRRSDQAPRDPAFISLKIAEAIAAMQAWNIGLTHEDFKAVEYIAYAFVNGGPDIKFTSYNRAPRPHHPSYRSLLEARDPNGAQLSYLAQEDRFRTVKELHRENRIVPVVGDFGGPSAFHQVAQELRLRGLEVKCFYASNVEFYLFRTERWHSYLGNLRVLPLAQDSYVIRSYANMWQAHPAQVPGSYMTTVMQSLNTFLANEAAGKNETYWELDTLVCIHQ